MALRAAIVCLVAALAVGPAGADTISEQKDSVDGRIARLGERVARMQEREKSVRAEVASASMRIRELSDRVGDVSTQLGPLESDLRLRRLRLNRLDALLAVQTSRLAVLRRQHAAALRRLDARLVGLYKTDQPDTLTMLFTSKSVADILDVVDYAHRIAEQDRRIADEVGMAKTRVRTQLAATRRTRARHVQELSALALRVSEARALRDSLAASRDALECARGRQQESLAALTRQQRAELAEIDALRQVSAALAAKIAAQASRGTGAPSAAGLVWPVSGSVTSGYGTRWGRMHEGIDIAAPSGTPIAAAAAGTVIYAGWMGGYGNLVVLDHGNGLATAYGHQSSIAVANGQTVAQGQVVGYVGSTGHSTGPHLHFEVRVNGAPVDPLGYL